MDKVELLYLKETGRHATDEEYEFTFLRRRGEWIIDCSDGEIMNLVGASGALPIPNENFVNWMREKLNELL